MPRTRLVLSGHSNHQPDLISKFFQDPRLSPKPLIEILKEKGSLSCSLKLSNGESEDGYIVLEAWQRFVEQRRLELTSLMEQGFKGYLEIVLRDQDFQGVYLGDSFLKALGESSLGLSIWTENQEALDPTKNQNQDLIEISVVGPFYFSDHDEKSFFTWLETIPCVKSFQDGIYDCKSESSTLVLRVSAQIDNISLRELVAIMKRYRLDMSMLRQFRTKDNEKWFAKKSSYWHDDVFRRDAIDD